MIGMVRARWPGRVDETIVDVLLHILNDLRFQLLWPIFEHSDPRRVFFNNSRAHGSDRDLHIVCDTRDNAINIGVGHTGRFAVAARAFASSAVRDSLTDDGMIRTEGAVTHDAKPRIKAERAIACRA